MTSENGSKIQQHSILGLLGAMVALQGWGAVHPDQIDNAVKQHSEEIQALREHQAELKFSIRLLAANVQRLTEAIEKAHEP